MNCDGKFNNYKNSAFALRELNDKLCLEHVLPVCAPGGMSGGLFNLKEASKTLNFLTDNGITDYDELAEKAMELSLAAEC